MCQNNFLWRKNRSVNRGTSNRRQKEGENGKNKRKETKEWKGKEKKN